MAENELRNLAAHTPYHPLTGEGSVGVRTELLLHDAPIPLQLIPQEMQRVPLVAMLSQAGSLAQVAQQLMGSSSASRCRQVWRQFVRIRTRYDFEFWAILFAVIKNKEGQSDIPFRLCAPQRKLLAAMEGQRIAGEPVRIILLKARQWGGSTLVQMYMAWIQLTQKTNWNSTICAHVKNSAQNIKGMYSKLIAQYPTWLVASDKPLKFTPYERSLNASVIEQRGCKVVIGSAESPNSVRGEDAAMAHCTEVAFWGETPTKSPEDLVRSVCGGIAYRPYTVIVYESTANGTGNYFYREWCRAKRGESDKLPLFVAWFEIEMYTLPVDNYEQLIETFGEYEWWLWSKGATLEAIAWYMQKRKEYRVLDDMMAEYPSDDVEAFKHSGETVFNIYRIAEIEKGCTPPEWQGELVADGTEGREAIENIHAQPDDKGKLSIWQMPDKLPMHHRYLVVVDVGGRSSKADYSVIAVIDRYWLVHGGKPEVVAQWRGHIDHDLLAWKAAQIAQFYHKALLVIESNTLESHQSEGAHAHYILEQVARVYDNLYSRTDPTLIHEGVAQRWGFHTNVATKTAIVDAMIACVRQCRYVEHDTEACHELAVYERRPNGSYGAKEGCHDDILMTRMIGLYISNTMEMPKEIARYRPKGSPLF